MSTTKSARQTNTVRCSSRGQRAKGRGESRPSQNAGGVSSALQLVALDAARLVLVATAAKAEEGQKQNYATDGWASGDDIHLLTLGGVLGTDNWETSG